MRFKFVFSAEWPSLPQCLALCLNIIIHSFLQLSVYPLVHCFGIVSAGAVPLQRHPGLHSGSEEASVVPSFP